MAYLLLIHFICVYVCGMYSIHKITVCAPSAGWKDGFCLSQRHQVRQYSSDHGHHRSKRQELVSVEATFIVIGF